MTRINCIPPNELTNKHLVAEYRELPRVFALARKPKANESFPTEYTLGRGHVKFFYNKLGYLSSRFLSLVEEMKLRGYKPNYTSLPKKAFEVPAYLWNDWTPTAEALEVNRQRIKERLDGRQK